MEKFEYKDPYLYRDESNKKWCIIYSFRYAGEKNFTRVKEYGKNYGGKSLNAIENTKERAKAFEKVLKAVKRDLEAGVILKETKTVVEYAEKKVKESKKFAFDENFKLFMKIKGYDNPIPKKELSAVTIESFHRRQFRPFLEKKGLVNDISKITKSHLLEFMNFYYLNDDPKIKWSNNTFNNKKGFLSSFFQTMVDQDILTDNPVKRIKSQDMETTERFTTFTKEERDILFKYFDDSDFPMMAAICRVMYHAYIRESELARLKVSDFQIENRQIRIHPDNAKGQKNKLVRFVQMRLPLQESLKIYLNQFEHQPDWYMFGKKYKPSPNKLKNHWTYLFRDALAELKELHPGKFDREGLSPYSLKHSGVTDFIRDNSANFSTTQLYQYVQAQCRHESFEMTQRYLKKLELNIEMVDTFDFI